MSAHQRERFYSAHLKLITFRLECRSRSAGIRDHVALESVIILSRNMQCDTYQESGGTKIGQQVKSTALLNESDRCVHIGDRESDIYELVRRESLRRCSS